MRNTQVKNYDHHREWVETQILKLTEVFAIDVAAYAVMSNHLHVVLHDIWGQCKLYLSTIFFLIPRPSFRPLALTYFGPKVI